MFHGPLGSAWTPAYNHCPNFFVKNFQRPRAIIGFLSAFEKKSKKKKNSKYKREEFDEDEEIEEEVKHEFEEEEFEEELEAEEEAP